MPVWVLGTVYVLVIITSYENHDLSILTNHDELRKYCDDKIVSPMSTLISARVSTVVSN